MKNIFIISILILSCTIFTSGCSKYKTINGYKKLSSYNTMNSANKTAGFTFPLKVENYTVEATKNILQIKFSQNNKEIKIRKSILESRNGDISGNKNKYPINRRTTLPNGVYIDIQGDNNLIYVTNFSAETGYYSITCDKGLNIDEIYEIFKIIEDAEAPKNIYLLD